MKKVNTRMLSEKEWQELLQDQFKGSLKCNVPMKNHTRLAIGGPADALAVPDDPISLKNLIVILKEQGIPFMTLGSGTNMLVRDGGIEGMVIMLQAFNRIELIKEYEDSVDIFVEAGLLWQKLVNYCKEKGYAGVEGLTGIPGTVGGAIYGNAGSYGYETKDVIDTIAIMDQHGMLDRVKAESLGFDYRTSAISGRNIILSANMRMKKDASESVSMRTKDFFRDRKEKQPLEEKSAGCVFKNPKGSSAGKLIDETGCKGMTIGEIQVSPVHANFFVNRGNGTAVDYMNLMEHVSVNVKKRCGITLEPEIRIVGRN
jgi:UDP-N-acetylmuramate dehydrogenase